MGHNVETMAYREVSGSPWHLPDTKERSQGIAGTEIITAEQMEEASRLGWTVSLAPIHAEVGATPEHSGDLIKVSGHRAVVRDSDHSVLGVVGAKFRPIQNRELFKFVEAVLGTGWADFETAGSLFGGRRVWVLARLRGDGEVGGSAVRRFLLASNGHDGGGALRIRYVHELVCCWNTLLGALGENVEEIYLRHTANALKADTIETAKRLVARADVSFDRFEREAKLLQQLPFNVGDMDALIRLLVPRATDEDTGVEILSGQAQETSELLADAFLHSPGVEVPGVAGTAWAALNAVTWWTTHARGTRVGKAREAAVGGSKEDATQDARLDSIFFGSSANVAIKAKKWLLDVAEQNGLVLDEPEDTTPEPDEDEEDGEAIG